MGYLPVALHHVALGLSLKGGRLSAMKKLRLHPSMASRIQQSKQLQRPRMMCGASVLKILERRRHQALHIYPLVRLMEVLPRDLAVVSRGRWNSHQDGLASRVSAETKACTVGVFGGRQ